MHVCTNKQTGKKNTMLLTAHRMGERHKNTQILIKIFKLWPVITVSFAYTGTFLLMYIMPKLKAIASVILLP